MSTKIEWCDVVWNPTTGCSMACNYCYALPFARRLQANPKTAQQYRNGFVPTFHPERLDIPLKWKKPRRIFVDSMGDLFDSAITDEQIYEVFLNMACCPQHTFLVLTKHSARMSELMSAFQNCPGVSRVCELPNIWLGVSIDSQQSFRRWWDLYYTCTMHRFISIEPMQGPIRFDCLHCHGNGYYDDNEQTICPMCNGRGTLMDRIEWVICGGQTGNRTICLHPSWVYDLRDRCYEADVPFFFKSWGSITGKKSDAILNGRECKEFPKEMQPCS